MKSTKIMMNISEFTVPNWLYGLGCSFFLLLLSGFQISGKTWRFGNENVN